MITSEREFDEQTGWIGADPAEAIEGEVVPPGGAAEGENDATAFDEFITPDLVVSIFTMPARIMARKTGDDWWRPEEEEEEMLEKATPAVRAIVREWVSAEVGPWGVLAGVLGAYYIPRVIRHRTESKKDPETKRREKEAEKPRPWSQEQSASSPVTEAAGSQQSASDFSVPFDE